MARLLTYLNNNILKIGVAFLIAFIALYPKLPSINITHTWVYIRLEDFFILFLSLVWLSKFIYKKTSINLKITWPIFLYWFFGLISLAFSILFIGPYLTNYFPKIAILSYLRRIEYMILFFIALSTIKSLKDLKDYMLISAGTIILFSIYAIGQHFYLNLWHLFPNIFKNFSFCFPSFQTGNEEFAKGIPLCLPENARVTSTFAGHYDLSAYLVLTIPIIVAVFFSLKRSLLKKLVFALAVLSIIVLIFTSSRNAFVAYLLGLTFTLTFIKKKKFILPFVLLSIFLMLIFSGSMAKRFMQTLRFASVVTNNQGQVVGQLDISEDLKKKLEKDRLILANIPTQNLPEGSGYIGLPQIVKTATSSALVKKGLSLEEARRLKLENGGIEISSVSGSFLVKKVLVYDISLTTRFQAEWPNAWKAFSRNPFLGSGFSTITLATDNDYLRMLGETGAFGLISFMLIFIVFGLLVKEALPNIDSKLAKGYLLGISGGVIGLFMNATLIDVFEASKVAETLWILMGIAVGVILLYKKQFNLKNNLKRIFSSQIFVVIYLFLITMIFYFSSVGNYFIGDDFTWLKWSANATLFDLPKLFIDSGGFFYRPVSKTVMFFLWTLFSFQPYGYHLFALLIHLLIGFAAYLVSFKLFKKKIISFTTALIFLTLPSQGEALYWIASISVLLSSLFIVYGLLSFLKFRKTGRIFFYFTSLILYLFALGSYEMGVVLPFLMAVCDSFIKSEKNKKFYLSYVPFILLIPVYYLIRQMSNTVSMGGSYAYNLLHLVPNIAGNFIGYWGLFIFGERFFSIYDASRLALRKDSAFITIILLFAFAILIITLYLFLPKLKKLAKNFNFKIFIYSIIFSFVSLLPFLGLGNISERYSYLSSIGFSFAATVFIVVLAKIIQNIFKNRTIRNYSLVFLLILVSIFYFREHLTERSLWERSGRITNRTLAYLRIYHEDLGKGSTLYFANIPTKQGQSWIFPVGLEDGIWFVFRDPNLKVVKLEDEQEARAKKEELKALNIPNSYVFYFDKKNILTEIK